MNVLKKVVGFLTILIVLLLVISLFLPDSTKMERSIVIDASADKIFPHVNSMKAFDKWSPWNAMEPDVEQVYTGPDSGVGSKVAWSGEILGKGTQEIVVSEPFSKVETSLVFDQRDASTAAFTLAPTGQGTEVTWSFYAEHGYNPINRYFGLAFDAMLGPTYEEGLQNLKKTVESQQN